MLVRLSTPSKKTVENYKLSSMVKKAKKKKKKKHYSMTKRENCREQLRAHQPRARQAAESSIRRMVIYDKRKL
jgi:hypothetical protein